ncbi:MAG: glycosyltransferase family 1 protein [Pyrinomonadaceae bacterium]|nr:glycosyltransferase family 1 protein [Phycisphaerales bacterium]
MNILLTTVGSAGDIHPFVAIGRELLSRGHAVSMLANPYFASTITHSGIGFVPLGDEVNFQEMMRIPNAVHPRKGGITVLRELVFPNIKLFYERATEVMREIRPDVVVGHHIAVGTSWACERLGVPLATCVLAPAMWFNPLDKSVYAQGMPENPHRWFTQLSLWLARLQMRSQYDRPVNAIRRDLGLPPQKNRVFDDTTDVGLSLGMWSRHFRGPLPGDPASGVICGFPWHDHSPKLDLDGDLALRYLDECEQAGDPPIVFSLGTAVVHVAGGFYHAAAEACRKLGRRGLLLTNRPEYAPKPSELPPGVRAFAYAPFSKVMPRAACTVHHGGVGTTAQGLRSGKPTVIVPHAYDQFDHAARTKRLGVSGTVWATKANAASLQRVLGQVLGDSQIAVRAREMGRQVAAEDGAIVAADAVEKYVSKR